MASNVKGLTLQKLEQKLDQAKAEYDAFLQHLEGQDDESSQAQECKILHKIRKLQVRIQSVQQLVSRSAQREMQENLEKLLEKEFDQVREMKVLEKALDQIREIEFRQCRHSSFGSDPVRQALHDDPSFEARASEFWSEWPGPVSFGGEPPELSK